MSGAHEQVDAVSADGANASPRSKMDKLRDIKGTEVWNRG